MRLYSVDDAGRSGIVFLTLEAQRLATVLLARMSLGLPYTWSAMSDRVDADVHHYRSRRRWPRVGPPDSGGAPRTRIAVRVGSPVEATEVETWLTSRWGLHTRVAGRTVWVPNHHDPWPLHAAEVLQLDSDLVGACGVDVAGAERLRALWSPGVRTRFGLPAVVAS